MKATVKQGLDNPFLNRQPTGDLRDLIQRPHAQKDTVAVGPHEVLVTAYNRMKLYDVSQLPVMEGQRIVGILDESDLLLPVYARIASAKPCRPRWLLN